MTLQHDRTYWRTSSTRALIETARNSGDELAIALGERLEELEANEEQVQTLLDENRELSRMVDSRDDDIEYYRAQLGLD